MKKIMMTLLILASITATGFAGTEIDIGPNMDKQIFGDDLTTIDWNVTVGPKVLQVGIGENKVIAAYLSKTIIKNQYFIFKSKLTKNVEYSIKIAPTWDMANNVHFDDFSKVELKIKF